MTYSKTQQQTVELAGLRFVVTHRSIGDDGGPTIGVNADIDGRWTEVLRFDCFRKMPHYHAPSQEQKALMLDPSTVGNGLGWALTQIREHIPELLSVAGYTNLARQADRNALANGWTQVRDAVEATAPEATPAT